MCYLPSVRALRTAIAILAAVSLTSCTLWAPKAKPTWKDATGGEQFERLLWEDIRARNLPSLERRIALTVTWMTADGPLDRTAAFDRFGRMQITSVSIGEVKVTPNRDTMTVAYHMHRAATVDGAPLPSPVHALSVWQHSDNGWILIAHSEHR